MGAKKMDLRYVNQTLIIASYVTPTICCINLITSIDALEKLGN